MKLPIFALAVLFCAIALAEGRAPYCGVDISNPPAQPLYTSAPDGYKLELVQLLIRHGDRLPIDTCWAHDNVWDCDLNIEERSIPPREKSLENVTRLHRKHYLEGDNVFPGHCMAGQLTRYGYNQHLINGGQLFTQYSLQQGFMPKMFDSSKWWLRSTDIPRTLQSAQGLLRGMYPWMTIQGANGAPATEIVDIYTVDAAREWLYPNPGNCPRLQAYETAAKQSPAYQNFVATTLTPLMQELSIYYGVPVSSMPIPINVFDCLGAHKCHGYPTPGNVPDNLYNRVVAAMEWEYNYIYNFPTTQAYGTLAMGRLYNDVVKNMITAIANFSSNSVRTVLYSAHDTSVMPFLNAIGAWDGKWAPYASLIQMETWVDAAGNAKVRWIYNREELRLPGCGSTFCSFSNFLNLVAPVVNSDTANSCRNNPPSAVTDDMDMEHTAHKANLGVYTNDGW